MADALSPELEPEQILGFNEEAFTESAGETLTLTVAVPAGQLFASVTETVYELVTMGLALTDWPVPGVVPPVQV